MVVGEIPIKIATVRDHFRTMMIGMMNRQVLDHEMMVKMIYFIRKRVEIFLDLFLEKT